MTSSKKPVEKCPASYPEGCWRV